jgi:sterol desaturase/sphingolipid hydroxylase (fatty acid hydroxylase superfamily)
MELLVTPWHPSWAPSSEPVDEEATRLVPVILAVIAVFMILAERAWPARPWPHSAGWWSRALILNAVQVAMVYLGGVTWNGWFVRHRPWSADSLGLIGGALVGYVVHAFVYYWWHRWRHELPFLWRWLHQVHHSPRRIEIATSFYKHPLEIFGNGLLSSAILYLGCGLGPPAAATAVFLSGAAEFFYHWNVRTPHWLGYLVQRPESHCVHHQSGVHAFNYGDLPIFDIAFGTFRNPREFSGSCGFSPSSERRLPEMLRGLEVQ